MRPSCPRCRELPLEPVSSHGVTALVCARCHGLWIDHVAATHLAEHALARGAAAPAEGLPCAVCRTSMRAWNVRGVVLDRCDVHGLWFDHAELDRIVAEARNGGPAERKPVKTDDTADSAGFIVEAIAVVVGIFT